MELLRRVSISVAAVEINTKIDARREGVLGDDALVRRALLEQNQIFRDWWNLDGKTDGLTERERTVYQNIPDEDSVSLDALLKKLDAKLMPLMETLQLLCGSGLIRQAKPEKYEISSRLFRKWTQNQETRDHSLSSRRRKISVTDHSPQIPIESTS